MLILQVDGIVGPKTMHCLVLGNNGLPKEGIDDLMPDILKAVTVAKLGTIAGTVVNEIGEYIAQMWK